MADFMIHELAWYPWLAWPLAFLAAVGVVYGCLWVAGLVTFCSAWMAHKRESWRYKDAVMCELRDDDDPPEYQHPDGDDDLDYCEHGVIRRTCTRCDFDWDGPPDDWSPVESWGPGAVVRHDMADLATILARAHELGLLDDDQLPDGPPIDEIAPEWWCDVCGGGPIRGGNAPRCIGCRRGHPGLLAPQPGDPDYRAERQGPPVCEDPECDKYGWVHPPPCVLVWTLPTAYPDMRLTDPGRPAGPPIPWSELDKALPLLPAVREHLEAAGFGGHEYVEDVAESAYTAAQAAEVQARMRELER